MNSKEKNEKIEKNIILWITSVAVKECGHIFEKVIQTSLKSTCHP